MRRRFSRRVFVRDTAPSAATRSQVRPISLRQRMLGDVVGEDTAPARLANAVDVTHSPSASSSQITTSGRWPPRLIAERAFSEMPTTRGAGQLCERISSASVVRHQVPGAVPTPLTGDAVGNQLRGLIVRAADDAAVVALPPLVQHHAVHGGHRAGAHAGVAGARHGVVVRIVGLPKPRAFGDEPMQALGPLMPESIDVVAAHLIDRDQHHELGLDRGRRARRAAALCAVGATAGQQQQGNETGDLFHDGGRIIQSARVETATDLGWRRLAVALSIRPAAQAPSLDDVLKRTAVYVADFRKQLSGIVAEETYRQEIVHTGRIGNGAMSANSVADAAIGLAAGEAAGRRSPRRAARRVRGRRQAVRDRQARLEQLLQRSRQPARGSATIIGESARYNIGSIQRNINTPLMALLFLDAVNQDRFRFKHVEKADAGLHATRGTRPINDTPVFRVSTEMWTVEYQERGASPRSSSTPRRRRSAGARTLLDQPVERQRPDQRADRGRRRRDRHRDGQLPIGAADGFSGAGRNARVLHPVTANAFPATRNTASSADQKSRLRFTRSPELRRLERNGGLMRRLLSASCVDRRDRHGGRGRACSPSGRSCRRSSSPRPAR